MKLTTPSAWVAHIENITNGGFIELSAGPGPGMTIAVRWQTNGVNMGYAEVLSKEEMESTNDSNLPYLLARLTKGVHNTLTPAAQPLPKNGLTFPPDTVLEPPLIRKEGEPKKWVKIKRRNE